MATCYRILADNLHQVATHGHLMQKKHLFYAPGGRSRVAGQKWQVIGD